MFLLCPPLTGLPLCAHIFSAQSIRLHVWMYSVDQIKLARQAGDSSQSL